MSSQYNRYTKVLHWIMAVVIIANIILAFYMDDLPKEDKLQFVLFHRSLGVLILQLAVIRIIWILLHAAPPMPAKIPKLEVKIGKIDGEFVAIATLNGEMTVNTGNGLGAAINLEVTDMTFQGFQVSNQAPYFSPGNWGLNDSLGVEVGFNGFGLRVSNIKPYDAGEGRAGVGFSIAINLVNALDISAIGSLGIEGTLEVENGQQKWIYDKVKVNKIFIDASFPSTEIKGILEWYGNGETPDPIWGEGFRGAVQAEFKGFNIKLSAAAQFGKKDDFKYFYVDALAELGKPIPLGAMQLKGFGGGVSYHMNLEQSNIEIVTASVDTTLQILPLGHTYSGTLYTPNKDKGLGLKATALIALKKEEVFNGKISLIFEFNTNNGLDEISLQGSGQFLESLNFDILPDFIPAAVTPPSGSAKLKAFIDLTYNFSEPSFHGNLNVFLNAGSLRGAGAGGKMVDAELHFDTEGWYIYIGRPEDGRRCGIIFDVPDIGSLDMTAYLDIGTNVPPMSDLPENVREIAYLVNSNSSLRNSGAGFVFGAALNFTLGAKIAGIITAQLSAGAGFDMMLRKYEGLSCGNIDPVGIDGWYASGQMWAYVEGELSAFGVNILSTGIAAVLQARLPNPFFAQATVGVRIKILFKTITKSLKLELGNDCVLASNDPNNEVGMEVITFLEPFDGVEDLETNVRPKAFFALELNKTYGIPDLNGATQNYKVELNNTTLTSSQGYNISHTLELDSEGTFLSLIPHSTLPTQDEITFEVTVNIFKNGIFLTEEIKSITFKTGEDLQYIPETNVSATYPVNGMLNFYKNEYNRHEGYVDMITGQANLLLNVPAGKEQIVRFISATGEVHCEAYEYDVFSRRLSFPLSPDKFENGQLYKMEIVRLDEGEDCMNVETPNSGGLLGSALGGESASTDPSNSQEDSDSGIESNPVLYSLYFRVSEYNTFGDKVDAITANGPGSHMSFSLSNFENLDILELKGTTKYEPLIEFRADLNNTWMDFDVRPAFETLETFLYGIDISVNDLKTEVGARFVNADLVMTESAFLSGTFNMNGAQGIRYFVPNSANLLFDEAVLGSAEQIMSGIAVDLEEECALNPDSPDCAVLDAAISQLEEGLPDIRPGSYLVNVKYKLPGGAVTTSKTIIFVKN